MGDLVKVEFFNPFSGMTATSYLVGAGTNIHDSSPLVAVGLALHSTGGAERLLWREARRTRICKINLGHVSAAVIGACYMLVYGVQISSAELNIQNT